MSHLFAVTTVVIRSPPISSATAGSCPLLVAALVVVLVLSVLVVDDLLGLVALLEVQVEPGSVQQEACQGHEEEFDLELDGQ